MTIMLNRQDLHDYQNRAVQFIKDKQRCGLFMDMGLGKTSSTLTAISDLSDTFSVNKVLIIAPLRVANTVWKQECAKWRHLQHLKVNICTGTERERLTALQTSADVYVINRENTKWITDLYKDKWPFDCVIIDESSSFKESSSQRFKAIRRILPFTNYMVLLTGTPSPNSLMDLWTQMYLIDLGQSLGRTKTAYTQRFFESDYMGYKLTPIAGAADKIHNLIAPKILSMTAEDYLEVPERIELVEKVVLPKKALEFYKDFERNLLAQLPDGEQVEALSAAVLANKLLQACIAKGTKVITNKGFVNIENVTSEHKIWDGEKWVSCYGNVYKGYKNVVDCYGIVMTDDHKVLTTDGWKTAKDVLNGNESKRFDREYLRNPYRIGKGWYKKQQSCLALQMQMREFGGISKSKFKVKTPNKNSKIMRMFGRHMECKTQYEQNTTNSNLAEYVTALLQQKRQRFQKLRAARNFCLRKLERIVFKFLERYERHVSTTFNIRQNRQQQRVFERKLSMGNYKRTRQKYQIIKNNMDTFWGYEFIGSCGKIWNKNYNFTRKNIQIQNAKRKMVHKAEVYDLVNCGENNRFTVIDDFGRPLIVHNCNGAMYIDESKNYSVIHDLKLDALEEIIETNPDENILVAYNYKSDLERLQKRFKKARVLDKDPQTVIDWNSGKIKLMLAHPASAGHGLNIQHGGSMIVWFGLNWSLELDQQFNARLHRQGQTKPVRIIRIVAENCLDERVLQVLELKDRTQSALINALKG